MLYDNDSIASLASELLDRVNEYLTTNKDFESIINIRAVVLQQILYFSSFIKNDSYSQEEEIRLCYYPIKNDVGSRMDDKQKSSQVVYTEDAHVLLIMNQAEMISEPTFCIPENYAVLFYIAFDPLS